MTFRIAKSSSREEWLDNRLECLTGTDIAALMTGGAKTWERVRASKQGYVSGFDNRYMAWGREREPVIAQYVTTFVDSRLEPNDQFLINDELGIGCTPDMIGGVHPEGDGLVADIVGEIKTSKHPIPDLTSDKAWMKYRVQTQVELMVTGADMLVFAWEQHSDEWPQPTPHDIETTTVKWDRELQARIMETVERFNAGEQPPDFEVQRILFEMRSLNQQFEKLKARDRELRDELQSHLQVGDKLSHEGVSVAYYEPSQRSRFDSKAFAKAHPDLAEQYTTITAGKPTLRVTFLKED
ncbi:YqaJ viral recombinase family protein [uncultured Corynebacterium sp.]|uniref:YqaJ viral recombinase family protein n=1 Tax=uncultured Corynebacterium sp. TaxID=159447 RepID=UPI002594C390|nr:YqaJ viral recombinase family protein [uncultured Corynebacterium sp.]